MAASSDIRTATASGNVYLDALTWGYAYAPGYTIKYVLQGSPGDGPYGGTTWSQAGAAAAFSAALASWSEVANIAFVQLAGPYNGTGDTGAYDWIESFAPLAEDLLGEHQLPHPGTLTGQFNIATGVFDQQGLIAGGIGFAAFVHETGHGLGLLHPHNEGGEPADDPVFPGVNNAWETGDAGLNQGLYTVMSYNHGFEPIGTPATLDFGWEMGPMAFDIAAIQRLYGPNMATRTGNSNYDLPDMNAPGTGWTAIWDAGGRDTISAGSTMSDAVIDLRAATLDPAKGGAGGFLSHIAGVLGGVTIAQGVIIENATGGGGDDWLVGNGADNRLDGGAGFDTVDYSGMYAAGNLQALSIDLKSGRVTGYGDDTLVSIEGAVGGPGNDLLIAADGKSTANSLRAFRYGEGPGEFSGIPANLDYHFTNRSDDPTFAQEPGMASAVINETDIRGGKQLTFTTGNAQRIILDIDNSYNARTEILVFDSRSNLIARSSGSANLDPGSASLDDAYLVLDDVPQNEQLTVRIDSGQIIPGDGSYDFKVSLQTTKLITGTSFEGSTLDGGFGDDTLVNGSGNDRLFGGYGDDIAIFHGSRSDYAVSGSDSSSSYFYVSSDREGNDVLGGVERLQFSDGTYFWDMAAKALIAQEDTPQISWTMLTSAGFAGAIGGSGSIFGTTGLEDIRILDQIGVVGLDVSFNRGGDIVRLSGEASEWLVFSSGSSAIFQKNGTTSVEIPAGPDGIAVVFDDGSRELWIDTNENTLKLGDKAFGYSPVWASTASANPAPSTDSNTDSQAKLLLMAAADVTAGGNFTVFGTSANETVRLLDGNATLDPSFNKGGDTLVLNSPFSAYQAQQLGSSIILSSGDSSILIPVGMPGMEIESAQESRSLFLDTTIPAIVLGVQQIGADLVPLSAFA